MADGITQEPIQRDHTRKRGRSSARRKRDVWIWVFLLPTVVLFGMYTLYPIGASYWYSLVRWNGFSDQKTFIGLANYQAVLADPWFWNSFKVTLVFLLLVVPARIFLSFIMALILNSPKLPLRGLLRTTLFIPVVTTTAIVGVVMQFIFDPGSGPTNTLLKTFGFDPVNFLGESRFALFTVAMMYIWKFFGITMIYWMAALQTIPLDVLEAARVDGAGVVSTFRYITVPMLKPFVIIISLLTFEEALHAFDLMMTMTGGGPYFSTEIIEIYIYRWAFASSVPQLGHASAAAVLFGLFVMILGVVWVVGMRAANRMRTN